MSKDISKSIRITEKVNNYIDGFEGKNFNDRLENMVVYCMQSEKERNERLKYLDEEVFKKYKIIEEYDRKLKNLRNIEISVHDILSKMKVLDSVIDKL